jgi:hypothetical protein
MTKWEYHFVSTGGNKCDQMHFVYIDLEDMSNKLGKEGWELVGITSDLSSNTGKTYNAMVFKREKTP